jgi:antitoxin PrlF
MMKSTMSSKGQLTVPVELREKLGLEAGTVIQFEYRDGQIFMRKGTQADHPVDRLYGTLHLDRSVDEILDEMRGPRPAVPKKKRTARKR